MIMMENSTGVKLKRKDFDDFHHDFSHARKIRRLDVDLPPIIEMEEAEIPVVYEQSMSENNVSNRVKIEELPFVPEDEEKAIVVFKPTVNNSQFYLPSNYSIDRNLFSSFKNQALLGSHWNASTLNKEWDETVGNGDDNMEENMCRAVIPWVPSQQPDPRSDALDSQTEVAEPMEADEMEIEDTGASNVDQHNTDYMNHQWQQQQCIISQAPLNTTTPIVWYR